MLSFGDVTRRWTKEGANGFFERARCDAFILPRNLTTDEISAPSPQPVDPLNTVDSSSLRFPVIFKYLLNISKNRQQSICRRHSRLGASQCCWVLSEDTPLSNFFSHQTEMSDSVRSRRYSVDIGRAPGNRSLSNLVNVL